MWEKNRLHILHRMNILQLKYGLGHWKLPQLVKNLIIMDRLVPDDTHTHKHTHTLYLSIYIYITGIYGPISYSVLGGRVPYPYQMINEY